MNSDTAVIAGADIEEGQEVRIETRGSKTVAYPVDSHYDDLLLPTAVQDASCGDIVIVRS